MKCFLSHEKERKWRSGPVSALGLRTTTVTAVTRQRHTVLCRQKGLFYPDYSPHGWEEKGLVCNHQRNADRIHSIILMRIQDLFWRSFFGFFLPVPLSPNEAICIHGASEARMESDRSQTRIQRPEL